MTILTVLFSIALVLDCLLLSLLVLVQLPKKEAGAGVAFGGGATDALFGAGSGTALTQLTKYATVSFFALVVILSIMTGHLQHSDGTSFKDAVTRAKVPAPATPALSTAPTTNAPSTNAGFGGLLSASTNALTAPVISAPPTNAPAAATNAPGKK